MAVHEKKAPSLPPVGKRLPAGGAKEYRQIFLTGLVVILFSELYFSFALKTFRISLAVAVVPVLLVTLARESNPFITGLCTSALVGGFRFGLSLLQQCKAGISVVATDVRNGFTDGQKINRPP